MFYLIVVLIVAALFTMWMLATGVDEAMSKPDTFWPSNFEA